MADAFVTFIEPIKTPGNVTGGGPIGQDEFLAEFKVRVVAPGCYTILPTLRAYTRLPSVPLFDTDADVGYVHGATVKCYCFKGQEEKTFWVTGQGAPQNDRKALQPKNAKAIPLEKLAGTWPKKDFPFGNLELYVAVKVVRCHERECARDGDCGDFNTNDDDEQKVVGSAKSKRPPASKIQGGPSPKETLEEAIKKAIEATKPN